MYVPQMGDGKVQIPMRRGRYRYAFARNACPPIREASTHCYHRHAAYKQLSMAMD